MNGLNMNHGGIVTWAELCKVLLQRPACGHQTMSDGKIRQSLMYFL